jgi:hypothetical protein
LNSKPEDLHKISAGGTKSFYQQFVRGNKFISKDKQEKTELLLSEEPGTWILDRLVEGNSYFNFHWIHWMFEQLIMMNDGWGVIH